MINLELSEEQTLLADAAERYLRKAIPPSSWKGGEPDSTVESRVWKDFSEMGWLALCMAQQYDGMGGTLADLAVLMERCGHVHLPSAYLPTIVLGGGVVERLAIPAVAAPILEGVVNGSTRLALACGSNVGKGVGTVKAEASTEGTTWTVSGEHAAVLGGNLADFLIVAAEIGSTADETGSPELGIFVIPAESPGVIRRTPGRVGDWQACDIAFRNVQLGANAFIGRGLEASQALRSASARALVAGASFSVGVMDELVRITVDYTRQRVQFGSPLSQFQAVRHKLVDMAVAAEEARSITWLAALSEEGDPGNFDRVATAARIKTGRAGRFVAEQAVQLHGAMGVTNELNVGVHYKGILGYELVFGATEEHLENYRRASVL